MAFTDSRLFIQLIGQIGVGKSFMARKLAEAKQGAVLSFAKDVYRLASIVKGQQVDKSKPEDRELLKLIGTTWGRESRELSGDIKEKLEKHKPMEWGTPDIWARIFVSNCRKLPENVSIVNDDTRFLNELEISMRTLGFIPALVACGEETRLKRLQARGDIHDPSDTDHDSEELANLLAKQALIQPLLPVIWNDNESNKPMGSWIFQWREFIDIAKQSKSNLELAMKLDWSAKRADALISTIRKEIGYRANGRKSI